MVVTLQNIQGFRGEFTYTIEPGLNVITSMYNGTGKTTFFECLKFLHNPASFDKTNRKFLRNKNESRAMFMLTIEECCFGFIIEGDQYSIVSKLKDEEVFTHSQSPHPLISHYTQVFFTEDSFINICDRFLNLFSTSHTAYNHDLVTAFLTHASLEKSYELIELEKTSAQQNLTEAINNLTYYDGLLQTSHYYPNIEKFRKALDCEEIVVRYERLDEILQFLRRCNTCKRIIDISVLDPLAHIYDILAEFSPECPPVDTSLINSILPLAETFTHLKHEYAQIATFQLDALINLSAWFNGIQIQFSEIDATLTASLLTLYEIFVDIAPVYPEIDISPEEALLIIYDIISKLHQNMIRLAFFKRKADEELQCIKEFEYQCPVKGIVYIVGGECLSVQSATQ